jgi:spermidine/putrescine transport system permease protein
MILLLPTLTPEQLQLSLKFVYTAAARGIPAQANVIGSAMFFLALAIVIAGQFVNRRKAR